MILPKTDEVHMFSYVGDPSELGTAYRRQMREHNRQEIGIISVTESMATEFELVPVLHFTMLYTLRKVRRS